MPILRLGSNLRGDKFGDVVEIPHVEDSSLQRLALDREVFLLQQQ